MKQQFGFENLRVRSLKSIRNLDLMLTVAVGYIGFISEKRDERIAVMKLIERSKRIYGVNKFAFLPLHTAYLSYFQNAGKLYTIC